MTPFCFSSFSLLLQPQVIHQLGPQCVQTPISPNIQTYQENTRLHLELGRRGWSCPILRFQNSSYSVFAETSWDFSAEGDESTLG